MPFDYSKGSLLLEFNHHAGETPSLDYVRGKFDLRREEIDADYGVMALDESISHPAGNAKVKRTWMVTVSETAGLRIEKNGHKDFIAVFSNAGQSNPPEM